MLNRVFLILCFFLVFSSCKKEVADYINISFSPTEQYEIRNSREMIDFSIKVSSNIELSELVIVQIVNNSIIDTMYHEPISGLEKTELYNYTCPDISSLDTSEVKLIFYCSNTNGDVNQRAKVFSLVSETVYLSETTGHTMFSSNSTEFNAYNLYEGIPMFNSDSTSHISDNTDSISDVLSRKWVSMSSLEFSKNNSLDYANVTSNDLENAYNSSLKKEFVENIQSSDIIITLINETYIVIRIDQVIDDVGSQNDRYIFSIKK
jgi:hypothetical protein